MTNERKDIRHYVGALGIFVLIVCLLLFLSFVEIPPVNKDLFVAIVGTLVSSLGIKSWDGSLYNYRPAA